MGECAHQVFCLDGSRVCALWDMATLLWLRFTCKTAVIHLEISGRKEHEVRGRLIADALVFKLHELGSPRAVESATHDQDNVALHEVRSGDRSEGAVPEDPARGRDHREERRQDGLALLELIELDERVQKRDGDEDASKVGVLKVCL